MRNPNSYGSIEKMSGNRRKPYMVRITTGWELTDNGKAKQIRSILGYYATKKEAAIALAEYNKQPYNLDRNKITLSDIYALILPRLTVSEARKDVYDRAWNKYLSELQNRPISSIKAYELQDVIDACQYGYSTKVVIRTVLKHIYTYALQNNYIDRDYSAFIHIESEDVQIQRRILSSELIADAWKHSTEPYYAFTLIMLYSGMRLTELRELPVANIDMDAGTISITKAKNKQSIRTIPIHDKIKPIVQQCIDNSHTENLFDFNKSQYEYFATSILGHYPYDCRHTFATRATELDIKKVVIQRIIGHKPDSVLEQFYLHLSIENLRSEINKIDY